MKSYTDLEQSKKLAEILPLESADMCYFNSDAKKIIIGKWKDATHDEDDIPAWSLAALLGVLPRPSLHQTKDGEWYCNSEPNRLYFSKHYDNPIDACVEMIIKLNELKML